MLLGCCQHHKTSGNILVQLLVQEYLFEWQYIAFFRAYLDTILKALLSSFCLNFETSHLALNEDYFKRFVPHFPIGHKSNPVNLGRSELWTLKELMSPLALVTYFTTKPYWILALKYTKTNELGNGTKTSHSIVCGTKVYVKEMSSYIAMIYRVSHWFGNSTFLLFWPGNVWRLNLERNSSPIWFKNEKNALNLSVNVCYQFHKGKKPFKCYNEHWNT